MNYFIAIIAFAEHLLIIFMIIDGTLPVDYDVLLIATTLIVFICYYLERHND